MDRIIEIFKNFIGEIIDQLTAPSFWLQVLFLILVILTAYLAQAGLRRYLRRVQARLEGRAWADELPWVKQFIPLLEWTLWALLSWLFLRAILDMLEDWSREPDFLGWSSPLLLLWLAYSLFLGVAAIRLRPEATSVWQHRILRPLLAFAAGLYLAGLLDNLLGFSLGVGDDPVTLGTLLSGVIVLAFFIILSRQSRSFLSEVALPRAGFDGLVNYTLSALIGYAIVIIGVIVALGVAGISLTAFTIIIGGLSVGIGLSLEGLISNFVGGLILLLVDRSIKPGDVVQVDDMVGRVMEIGIRSIRVKTRDARILIVPNRYFLDNVVTNYSVESPLVRIHIAVGTSYDSDPNEVKQALLAAAEHPLILASPPPNVHFTAFGESSYNFELLIWTEQPFLIPDISSDLRFAIWQSLKERQIEIPFPQRTIHIRSMPESNNG